MSLANTSLAAGAAAAVLLSSCSKTHSPPTPSRQTDQPVLTGEPAGDNAADVVFAETVSALDRQAVDVSLLARTHAGNSGIQALAATNAKARESEMQIVNVLLVQWNTSPDGSGPPPARFAAGMLDHDGVAKLQSAHAAAFDALWVQSMISLDNGALSAAKAEVANGRNVDAIDVAKRISTERPAEIDQLSKLR